MNHTKNYGLPQWELNDLIKMEDFNSMNASIENGLTTFTSLDTVQAVLEVLEAISSRISTIDA